MKKSIQLALFERNFRLGKVKRAGCLPRKVMLRFI
jgi:hypothetical protein